MNTLLGIFVFVVSPLGAVLFVARLIHATFSTVVSEQMRLHPIRHPSELPVALGALRPGHVQFYGLKMLKEFKSEPQVVVVKIKIFGCHATGGHSTPYFGLEVPVEPGAEDYRPKSSRGGVSGNSCSTYRKVAERVFEVY